jgi:phosphoglycerate dehydrogenase-like enzyme
VQGDGSVKLVIASDEGEHNFDELLGSIPDLEYVVASSPAEALSLVADADVYYGRPSDELIAAAPKLRLIQAQSAGVDFVMKMPALQASDVPLANTRGAHAPSIAEHTFALLLALTRGLPTCSGWQQQKYWARGEAYRMPREIMGSTIGIIGYGAIGRAIAQRAVGFGMKVVAVDLHPMMDAPYVDEVWPVSRFHDLLAESDVVAIAAPYTRATHHMFDEAAFAAMKRGSYIVVVSRGGIIDEDALVKALTSGHLAGAGLDVAEAEPLPETSPFWDLPNVILTPHLAGSSTQKERRCVEVLRENILRLQRGEDLVNLVDKQLGF